MGAINSTASDCSGSGLMATGSEAWVEPRVAEGSVGCFGLARNGGALGETGGYSKPSSFLTLSAKAGGTLPWGSRDHCTVRNDLGTKASFCWVSSATTGRMSGVPSATNCMRSSASFHSRRK